MKYSLLILLNILVFKAVLSQSITIYKDNTYEQNRPFHSFENNRFNILLGQDKQNFDLTIINNDSAFNIKCMNCIIEKDTLGWLKLFTKDKQIDIEIYDKTRNYTYKLPLKTSLPNISISGGYVPPTGDNRNAYLTPNLIVKNNDGRDTFNLIGCKISVLDSSSKVIFTEDIIESKIKNWDGFKKSLEFHSVIVYENIVIVNSIGDIIKYDVRFVIKVV